MKALPTEVPEMDHFDLIDLMAVNEMAAGMTKDEVLETFNYKWEELDTDEQIYFTEFFNYGRGMAKRRVVNNLIESTKGKGGTPAAMAYLRRFAKEFEGEVEGESAGSFSFTFGSVDKT